MKECQMCHRLFAENKFLKNKNICADCQIRINMAKALNKAIEQAIDEINDGDDEDDFEIIDE
jgi:hypothetical protein